MSCNGDDNSRVEESSSQENYAQTVNNPTTVLKSPYVDHISKLPLEVLEQILFYLEGFDLANLSFTCSCLYVAINQEILWQSVTLYQRIYVGEELIRFSHSLISEGDKGGSLLPAVTGPKLEFLISERVRKNWARSNYKEGIIHQFGEEVRLGYSDDHLVALESGRLRVWRISGQWISQITSRSVNISLSNPGQTVYQILVHKSIALLCFSFGDQNSGTSDFQQIQAFDLTDSECPEVWHLSLLGTQYHIVKLLGGRLVILDLLQDRITIYNIELELEVPMIVLEHPRHSVRIPHGDMSASSTLLAIPGKRVPENSPIMTVWDLTTGHRKLLGPDRPVCPFRWFQKSSISEDDNIVYGLLNRFRLLAWSYDDESIIFSLDLTTTSPGDSHETFTWLVTSCDTGLVLTVHQDLASVTVMTSSGDQLGKISPVLPPHCYEEGVVNMIEEVVITGLNTVIRVISQDKEMNTTCIILTTSLQSFIDIAVVRDELLPGKLVTLMSHMIYEHPLLPDSQHCSLIANNSKVFDVQHLGIKFYDYLHTEERFPGQPKCDCPKYI